MRGAGGRSLMPGTASPCPAAGTVPAGMASHPRCPLLRRVPVHPVPHRSEGSSVPSCPRGSRRRGGARAAAMPRTGLEHQPQPSGRAKGSCAAPPLRRGTCAQGEKAASSRAQESSTGSDPVCGPLQRSHRLFKIQSRGEVWYGLTAFSLRRSPRPPH